MQVLGKTNMLLFQKSVENQDQPGTVSRYKRTKSGTSYTCNRHKVEANKLECISM